MKKFRELMEASETMVFAYGRFNPPTTGHEKLIQKVVSVAGSNDYRIFPSHSQNPKKDPLPQALKTAYMRKMFKKYARNIVVTKSRNAIEIAVELYDQGYKDLIMIAGSDRVKVFDAMLNQYNGVEGKKHGYYKFDSIKIVSAGERDPDSEGVEGMSASKMRVAAVDGDKDSFLKGVPSSFKDGEKLYRDVRKHMGIREERDMGDMTDFESMRDAYLTGKVWNVGDTVVVEGVEGEIVRKGTNYLSYMTEDGKIHKAWLHEIELVTELEDLGRTSQYTIKKGKIHMSKRNYAAKPKEYKGKRNGKPTLMAMDPKSGATTSFEVVLEWIDLNEAQEQIKQLEKMLKDLERKKKKSPGDGFAKIKIRELIADLKNQTKHLQLGERNYAKEYANYQGTPEQIARRSSRNKARRVMGDKTKIGMDVGHKDNNPMNNDPSNLRNEVPSDNRREPRLREYDAKTVKKQQKTIKAILKGRQGAYTGKDKKEEVDEEKFPSDALNWIETGGMVGKKRRFPTYIVKKEGNKYKAYDERNLGKFKAASNSLEGLAKLLKPYIEKRTGSWKFEEDDPCWDGYKQLGMKEKDGKKVPNCVPEETELDEAWWDDVAAKISQISHPKAWGKVIQDYVDGMVGTGKEVKHHQDHPSAWAADVVKKYKVTGLDARRLIKYINMLVDKGKLPKQLKAEFTPMEETMSFKDFVNQINNK